jgi:hypothetical protein
MGGSFAGYQVSFDDPAKSSVSDFLGGKKGEWTDFNREIEVPKGAKHLELVVYGRQGSAGTIGRALYDDFVLQEIPNLQGTFYVASQPDEPTDNPPLRYTSIDPTKKAVQVKNATNGFYVAMRDTYHPAWRLGAVQSGWLPTAKVIKNTAGVTHLKTNGFMNTWYVRPKDFCKSNPGSCHQNGDGSFDLNLGVEFMPQRWFHVGLLISGVAFAGIACYFAVLGVLLHKRGGAKLWRNR